MHWCTHALSIRSFARCVPSKVCRVVVLSVCTYCNGILVSASNFVAVWNW